MKKVVRILALTLVLLGTYSAAFSASQNKAGMRGGPAPVCEPADPECSIWPK